MHNAKNINRNKYIVFECQLNSNNDCIGFAFAKTNFKPLLAAVKAVQSKNLILLLRGLANAYIFAMCIQHTTFVCIMNEFSGVSVEFKCYIPTHAIHLHTTRDVVYQCNGTILGRSTVAV